VIGECDEDGWTCVQLEIPGGPRTASDVIAALAAEHMPIASFERVRLPLAELIERIVAGRSAVLADA
jgi:hypothetical protein